MGSLNLTQQIVVLILGGGLAGSIFTLVKAYLALRNNVDTREAAGIENLERWRRQADDRANAAEARIDRLTEDLEFGRKLIDFWWRRSMFLEQCLAKAGVAIPSCPPIPTRQVVPVVGPAEEVREEKE